MTFHLQGDYWLEDSVLWYALQHGVDFYKSLSLYDRINFKYSFFQQGYGGWFY